MNTSFNKFQRKPKGKSRMDNPLRDTGNINWAKDTNKNKQDKKHNTKSKNMSNTDPIKITCKV